MTDEELVAWVDENENIIKAIPISLANSDPKYLHQEIAGIIYDNQRRVLLQQRSLSKKVSRITRGNRIVRVGVCTISIFSIGGLLVEKSIQSSMENVRKSSS